MTRISATNGILASLFLAMSFIFCVHASVLLVSTELAKKNTSISVSRFLLLAFYYLPRSNSRASIVAAFSYLEVVITLRYRACAKQNAKQLPNPFAPNGAWKSLSPELGCLQWCDARPSSPPDILVREYCNPQWRIKWGSDLVQKKGFNTMRSSGVIGTTVYAHDQLQEESLFHFDFCLQIYIYMQETIWTQKL